MKGEEAEYIFGKRWPEWTEQEIIEFVRALDDSDPYIPLTLDWCMAHLEHVPRGTKFYKLFEQYIFGQKFGLELSKHSLHPTKPSKA